METLSRWLLGLTGVAFLAVLVRNASGASQVIKSSASGVSTIYGTLIGGGNGVNVPNVSS